MRTEGLVRLELRMSRVLRIRSCREPCSPFIGNSDLLKNNEKLLMEDVLHRRDGICILRSSLQYMNMAGKAESLLIFHTYLYTQTRTKYKV